jgi:hypothetical protein
VVGKGQRATVPKVLRIEVESVATQPWFTGEAAWARVFHQRNVKKLLHALSFARHPGGSTGAEATRSVTERLP